MAATNSNVAARFASALVRPTDSCIRPISGSNFYARGVFTDHSQHEQLIKTKGVFSVLSCADSYRTTIGYIVQNNHTNKREVWLTRLRYSNTTSRHVSHIGGAVRKLEVDFNTIFVTFYINADVSWPNRVEVDSLPQVVQRASTLIALSDAPKLRENSRRANLGTAADLCGRWIRKCTEGVPEGYAESLKEGSQKLIDELRSMRDYALSLSDAPLDELRASVRGFATLNKF